MAGRRGVEHDHVVLSFAFDDEIDHAIEQRHFGEPRGRRRKVDLPLRLADDGGAEHPLDVAFDALDVPRRFLVRVDFDGGKSGRISQLFAPIARSKMSDVECAGSVDTAARCLPWRAAASANAAEHVVLPTPPLPPKKSTDRL